MDVIIKNVLPAMYVWLAKNAQGEYQATTNMEPPATARMIFVFELEQDAINFKERWGDI